MEIEEEAPGGNFYVVDTETTGSSGTYTASSLAVNEAYQFRALAISQGEASSPSSNVTVQVDSSGNNVFQPVGEPTIQSVYAFDAADDPSDGSILSDFIVMKVTSSTDLAGYAATGYGVRSDDPYGVASVGYILNSSVAHVSPDPANEYTSLVGYMPPLLQGASYSIQEKFTSPGEPTLYSSVYNFTLPGTRMPAPTGLTMTDNMDDTWTADWSYSPGEDFAEGYNGLGGGEAGYFAIYGVQPGGQAVQVGTTSGESSSVTTLTFGPNGTLGTITSATQFFAVAQFYGPGAEEYSPYSNFATTTSGIPAAPSNLTAMAVSGGEIDLEWRDNSSNETGFAIFRGLIDDFSDSAVLDNVPADQSSYKDKSVPDGQPYYYWVVADTDGPLPGGTSPADVTTGAMSTQSNAAVAQVQMVTVTKIQDGAEGGPNGPVPIVFEIRKTVDDNRLCLKTPF